MIENAKPIFPDVVECEIRLLEHLFNASAVPGHIRPVKNPAKVTTIFVNFELKTVMDMVSIQNKPRKNYMPIG